MAKLKLSPTQEANFQSLAAMAIKARQVMTPKSATQTTLMLIEPNSFRINLTGEIITRLSNGGPAKPTSKVEENSTLQAKGQRDVEGKLAITKLPKMRIKISCTL